MAFTVAIVPTVFGNKNVRLINVIADAAEANVTSGFSVIEFMSVSRLTSCATGSAQVIMNKNSTGTAANGTIGVSGVSAGTEFNVICIGR